MADNVTLPGTGEIVAADEVTRNAVTEKQQIVKIGLGAEGAHDIVVDSGQQTMANSVPVVIASNQSAVSVDTELPTAAALADATANPTVPIVGSFIQTYNGTTWDRARSVVNGQNTTGTGVQAAGILGQLDDTSTGTVTENQFAPVRISSRRALLVEGVASGTAIATTISSTTSITPGSAAANLGKAEDAAHANGDVGVMSLQVRRDTPVTAANASADGDYVPIISDSLGQTRIGILRDSVTVTQTTSATPDYSIGDAIGGKITLTSVTVHSGKPVMLKSLHVLDKAGQAPSFAVLLFNADPSAATITDNSAFAYSTNNTACIGVIRVTAGDYFTTNGSSMATLSNLDLILEPSGSASLYAALVAEAAYNAASTSDMVLQFGFELA